ncbi:rod-binding protein [uncultured Albimonas sp.]|uniref:rod-binding protein n=1 Tax=uncultured Albimonas sp. TaxID=1331701 RepID=UPI0030EC52AE
MPDAAFPLPLPTGPVALAPLRNGAPAGVENAALRKAAVEFETMFLAEALSGAGLGRTPEGFGGGVGEEAFSSLLVREQARLLAEQGGIGLAERIYQSLVAGAETQ